MDKNQAQENFEQKKKNKDSVSFNRNFDKMYRQIGFLLHLFVLHLSLAEQQPRSDVPASPCPQIFQYKFNGNDWFGEIILPSPPIQHREVVLHLTLSLRAATAVS